MPSKLDTQRFAYPIAPRLQVLGRRFYDISSQQAYPSITTVLGHTPAPEKADWLSGWRARVGTAKADKIRDDAAQRGTNVHLMLERFVRGEDPQQLTFPSEHAAIFNSMKLGLSKVNTVYGQEVVLYSDALEVAGTCDMVAEYQGELAIVDYKTSTRAKTADDLDDYWLQTAFYAIAHNEMFGTDISKLVILMGVENKLPRVFKNTLSDELVEQLAIRTARFYDEMAKLA